MEYEVDISEINVSNYTFYKRFEGKTMSAQFAYSFWIRATIKA